MERTSAWVKRFSSAVPKRSRASLRISYKLRSRYAESGKFSTFMPREPQPRANLAIGQYTVKARISQAFDLQKNGNLLMQLRPASEMRHSQRYHAGRFSKA